MNRRPIQLGFILILLALLTGLSMPFLANPRLGLAAHTAGITGGLILIAVGALAGSFRLGRRASSAMMGSWVVATYGNWLACLLGGITGASRLTPIAGAGTSGVAWAETLVASLLQLVALASIVAGVLAVRGFRQARVVVAEPSPAATVAHY